MNVENFIARNSGTIQYGWLIWVWDNIMVEAEFHAVWRSPEGNYQDVSPAEEERVLFLPDFARSYEGTTRNNIRAPLVNDPKIEQFISVNDKISQTKIDFNDLNAETKMFALSLLGSLGEDQRRLIDEIAREYLGTESRCYCGSGKRFGECHNESG